MTARRRASLVPGSVWFSHMAVGNVAASGPTRNRAQCWGGSSGGDAPPLCCSLASPVCSDTRVLKWYFTSLTHITLIGLGGARRHPGCGAMPSHDVTLAYILTSFALTPGTSARKLTSDQGQFGCSALSACVHATIACEGEAYCIFGAVYCVYSSPLCK